MDEALYNSAWESVEFLIFDYIDFQVELKVVTGVLTKSEGDRMYREHIAARTAILNEFGVTYDELEAETDKRMSKKVKLED